MQKTLDDLKAMKEDFIRAEDVAPIIGAHPQAIRETAHNKPWCLGFPTTTYGNRTKIPRLPFIKFVESGEPWYLSMAMLFEKCFKAGGATKDE